VKGAIGNIVPGIEARKIGKVIELLVASAQLSFLPVAPKIPTVNRVGELGQRSNAARCCHAHNAGERIGAVQRAVRPAQNFDLIDPGCGKHSKIDRTADVVGRNAIDEDFISVAVAAADK
jgi:hypothetical protein